MSTKSTPRILGVEQLSSDAKWLKLEKIKWQDEDGEEVSHHASHLAVHCAVG